MALLQASINGLFVGGVYAIISAGFCLVFGVMKLVNFAHGDFMMAAMYAVLYILLGTSANPYIVIPFIAVAFFFVGYVFQRLFINGILKRERNVDSPNIRLFTIGVSFFLSNLALLIFSANPRNIVTAYTGQTFKVAQLLISQPRFYAFLIAIVCTVALYMILFRTEMGRALRAISQNRFTALLMGINVQRLYCIAFGIGIGLVAISANILIPFYYVFPTLASVFGVKAFIIVVMGGLGNITGSLLAGLLVGILEAVLGFLLGPTTAEMLIFIAFILTMLLRPNGLLSKGKTW